MTSSYTQLLKKQGPLVCILGLAYAATILFTLFGPALTRSTGETAAALSLLALTVHVAAFFFPLAPFESQRRYVPVFCALLAPCLVAFPLAPSWGQAMTVVAYAYVTGRIGRMWTHVAYRTIRGGIRGRAIAASLGLSFAILYLANAVTPSLSPVLSMIFPLAALGTCAFIVYRTALGPEAVLSQKNRPMQPNRWRSLFLIIIYIAGGFSYAGIYPHFLPYAHLDRFYSVLPLVMAMIVAGIVLDRWSRETAFYIGVCCLGVSFTFFVMPSSLTTYFLSQTFLQAGWAFVNAFGWSFSWDMARQAKDVRLFPRGIAAMLTGAALGTICHFGFTELGIHSKTIFGLVTFVPLFADIVWLQILREFNSKQETRDSHLQLTELNQLPEMAPLSTREMEICCHMVNGTSIAAMANELCISEATVKTHASKVYRKLNVPSRRKEIRKYVMGLVEAR